MKVILIGGWGYQASTLKPLIQAAPEGIEVLPFGLGDLYEMGKAANSNASCYYQAGLQQVLQFFTEPVTLMGWSTGAMIAYTYALQDANIEKIVLISATASFTQSENAPHGTPKAALLAMKKAARRDALSMLWKFDEKVFHPVEKSADELKSTAFEERSEILGYGLDYLIKSQLDTTGTLIDTQIRLIHGAQDAIISVAAGQSFADAVGTQLKIVDEAGHGLPLTHPDLIWQTALQ